MLDVGTPAPKFSLPGIPDGTYRLADLKGQFAVLYFYPKDDTPACTTEACDFRDSWQRIETLGATVWGISADSAEQHLKFRNKFELTFPLLADVDHAVCEKFGVWAEKTNYGRTYMGIVRSTFLIDPRGKIAAAWKVSRVKGHVAAVVAELERQMAE